MGTATETSFIEMTETDWRVAHAIAQTLVKQETDVNELGKAIAYLRNAVNRKQDNAGVKFFEYLNTLVNNGRTIGRTLEYYRTIEQTCSSYLLDYQMKPGVMLCVLGWASRLMRYYREGGATGEDLENPAKLISDSSQSLESERQAEIRAIAQTQSFQAGQKIEVEVKAIKGKKVTYSCPK
jgi:hypothetical protein